MAIGFDILLDENGDLPVVTKHFRSQRVIVQRVRFRLVTFLGEWLLDVTQGLPIFAWLAQKPPNVEQIGARIRREIEDTPGVVRVSRFSGSFDSDEQTLRFEAEIVTEDPDAVGPAVLTIFPTGQTTQNATPAVILSGGSGTVF